MDSNVSTDTRPSASFKGETLQIARENRCQNGLQAAPSRPPSGIHLKCRDKTLEKTLTKKGPRQRLPATTWQAALSRSSNPPMSSKDHPVTLFPSCLSLPVCKRNSDHTPSNPHQQGPAQCWHDTMTMDKHLLPILHLMDAVWPGDTHRSSTFEAASFCSGGLFFTGVVCEHSFVAKKLPSYCSESKDKATVKITPHFDSSQIITINDPFPLLSCMLINMI